MATINLVTKYASEMARSFKETTYLNGKFSEEYDFIGAKTVIINTPLTVTPETYDRTKTDGPRFGALHEMEDTVQELTLTQEPSFNISIDRGNFEDQLMMKKAGEMMSLQIEEQMVPQYEKYVLGVWSGKAGNIAGLASAPAKNTILGMLSDARKSFVNQRVPEQNRYCAMGTTYYTMLAQADAVLNIDAMGKPAIEKGVMGKAAGFKIIEIPDEYLPEDTYFTCWNKRSVMAPQKIKTARILTDHPDVDGWVLQGRNYYDAFVIGARAGGVYTAANSSKVAATPVVAITSHSAAITSGTSGATIYYTTDGTDPRYSKSAKVYTAAVPTTEGTTVKAYAMKAGMFQSAVGAKTDA